MAKVRFLLGVRVLAISLAVVLATSGLSGEGHAAPDDFRAFWLISPGLTGARSTSGQWQLGGELAATRYTSRRFGAGAAVGATSTQLLLEAQSVYWGVEPLFFGLNPGLVVDWSRSTQLGGEVTAWLAIAASGGHLPIPTIPLVPFARGELLSREKVLLLGLMLKLPFVIDR
jgi:hypothetical protein